MLRPGQWTRGILGVGLACAPASGESTSGETGAASTSTSATPTTSEAGSTAAGETTAAIPDLPPARACNGHAALCERRFDEVVFPCTHNAFAAREAGFKTANANQNHPVAQQLADGVRCMMLDVTLDDGEAAMCHGPCTLGRLVHADVAADIAAFMADHPDEVLTIIYQDDIDQQYIVDDLELVGLTDRTYVHAGGPWPTLAEMLDMDRRVVVTAESGGPPPDWYHHVWDLTWDTPYTFHSAAEFSCELNRGAQDNDLFLINHWVSTMFDTPSEPDAEVVNVYDVLYARASGCQAETGQLPNFVAVDFYDHGDLFAVVDALNGL